MGPWAIVLAAGSGRRFGTPKQFLPLGGRRLVDRVVQTAGIACGSVVVVLPAGVAWDGPPARVTVAGGRTHAESVRAGLAVVPPDVPIVVVCDAAHPLAAPHLYARILEAVGAGADAAVPVLPVLETTRHLVSGRFVDTVAKEGLVLVQSPQAFRTEALRRAHAPAPPEGDDSVLVQAAGGRVVAVPGDPRNVHVTTADELAVAAALLDAPGHAE